LGISPNRLSTNKLGCAARGQRNLERSRMG
jgi:hypothetical protein